MDTDKLIDAKERKRLYAIQYRKDNAEKLKERHNWRLLNDPDFAKRYAEKQEKRKHRYQESHVEAVAVRQEKRIQLAMARETRERERHKNVKRKARETNREGYNAYMRKYHEKNRDEINAKRRFLWANDLKHRSKATQHRIKRDFGLEAEQYADLYLTHNGKCAICAISEADAGEKGLAVDHCHSTGNVRGLLCRKCNTSLGQFKDDVSLLQKAIEYLNKFKE